MSSPGSQIPGSVVTRLAGEGATIIAFSEAPITGSSGAATGQVVRCSGKVEHSDGRVAAFSVIRKSLVPLRSGRHAAFANDPTHWAYWRRELHAYEAGILPAGPGLVAPRCLGIDGNDVYLEDIDGTEASVDRAAMGLAKWQVRTMIPDVPWLTLDQLGQRIAVTSLDWSVVDADPRVVDLWDRRDDLLDHLTSLPQVLSHGDYSVGNLMARGQETVALDWGTFGIAPVGADLAHLALSRSADPTAAFLRSAGDQWSADDVIAGFCATLVLVGSSRTHWMLSTGHTVPDGYVDFLWEHRPG